MDRRSFLRGLVGGVALGAAVRQWPFRVFSFPSVCKVYTDEQLADAMNRITKKYIVLADEIFRPSPLFYRLKFSKEFRYEVIEPSEVLG